MRKLNSFFIVLFLAFTIAIVVFSKSDVIKSECIQLFHKNAILSHVDNQGKLDGEFITYIQGKVHVKAHFNKGLRDGLDVEYYYNGQIKNERIFKMGKQTGVEKEYYEDGKLAYETSWKNNKRYGSEYHWLENGKLAIYNTNDLKNMFYYSEYDSKGNPQKIIGNLISNNIYSKIFPTDSVILLTNNEHYSNVNHLYIVIATPPNLKPEIKVTINQKSAGLVKVLNNTVFISNAFPISGNFKIQVQGELKDYNNKIIRKDSLNVTIRKN